MTKVKWVAWWLSGVVFKQIPQYEYKRPVQMLAMSKSLSLCVLCVWVQNQETGETGKKYANIKILPLCCLCKFNL